MVSKKVWKLAEKAGFVLWDEGDRQGMVDWACDYDQELVKFYKLVRQEINNDNRKKSLKSKE